MLKLIARRLLQMVLIMVVVSLVLFVIFDSDKFKKQIATAELGGFLGRRDVGCRLSEVAEEQGPRCARVRALLASGSAACCRATSASRSRRMRPVSKVMGERAAQHRHPRLLGVFPDDPAVAGLRDRRGHEGGLGTGQIGVPSSRSSRPRFPRSRRQSCSRVIIALGLGWLPAKSAMTGGWNSAELILPVLTLVLYDFGYVARMTRALDGRGHDLAIHPHRRLEGHSLCPGDHAARAAQCADRTVHRDRAAAQLAALRRRGCGGVFSSSTASARCCSKLPCSATSNVIQGGDTGRGLRRRAFPDHFGRRVHLPQPAHPVQLGGGDDRHHHAGAAPVADAAPENGRGR